MLLGGDSKASGQVANRKQAMKYETHTSLLCLGTDWVNYDIAGFSFENLPWAGTFRQQNGLRQLPQRPVLCSVSCGQSHHKNLIHWIMTWWEKADMGSWLSAADPAGRVAWKSGREWILETAPQSLELKEDMLDIARLDCQGITMRSTVSNVQWLQKRNWSDMVRY